MLASIREVGVIEPLIVHTQKAGLILHRVRTAVSQWRAIAASHRLSRAEIELVAQAFYSASVGS